MAKRMTITFLSDRPHEFYATTVFWFAEDLQSEVRRLKLGTMNDIDTAREILWIDLSDKHHLGKLREVVRKTLAKYSLTTEAVVTTA